MKAVKIFWRSSPGNVKKIVYLLSKQYNYMITQSAIESLWTVNALVNPTVKWKLFWFSQFLEMCLNHTLTPAGRRDYTRGEGSEPAELNGFSSLNVSFAQRCEMCRATPYEISALQHKHGRSPSFSPSAWWKWARFRSLIRGGGRVMAGGWRCVGGGGGEGARPYLGRSERFPRLLCKGGRTWSCCGDFIFTVSSTTYWQIQETV